MNRSSNKVWLVIGLFWWLAGCNTMPHGTFVTSLKSADSEIIAVDVVKQLTRLFPPAKTALSLQYAKNDAFGKTLTKQLRHAGYAVEAWLPNLIARPESSPNTTPKS